MFRGDDPRPGVVRRGRRLLQCRGEVVERSFAHMYATGGMRRVWVRGHENVRKRVLIQAAACNIGLLLRRQTGVGTPRSLQGRAVSAICCPIGRLIDRWGHLTRLGMQMDTDGARRLNRSSPSCLNSGAQRTDFCHRLLNATRGVTKRLAAPQTAGSTAPRRSNSRTDRSRRHCPEDDTTSPNDPANFPVAPTSASPQCDARLVDSASLGAPECPPQAASPSRSVSMAATGFSPTPQSADLSARPKRRRAVHPALPLLVSPLQASPLPVLCPNGRPLSPPRSSTRNACSPLTKSDYRSPPEYACNFPGSNRTNTLDTPSPVLGARGKSPAAFERRRIPPGLRCSSVEYAQYASSSRLATRPPRRFRYYAAFHNGLLGRYR